jgi:hypothetical protein
MHAQPTAKACLNTTGGSHRLIKNVDQALLIQCTSLYLTPKKNTSIN